MRTSFKFALLLTSGLQLAIAVPALAQTGAPPPPVGMAPEASQATPAAQTGRADRAQAGDNADAGDIIVTARRTDERLQDVPISITVFNQQQISNRNIVAPEDLALYTPSLSTNGVTGRENTSYSIRGFTQDPGTSPSVAVYFADVVAPRSGASIPQGDGAGPGSFYDLQNVQVLKGPQGTLFGRNTTGGAVLIVPQKPTGRFEGYVEGLYGSYNWKGLQGAINAPLTDTIRARLSFDYQDRDGLTKDAGAGPDLDNRHYIAVRGSVVWDVTPDIENYTILSFLHTKSNGSGYSLIGCDPASFIGSNVCGPFATRQASGPHTASTDINNPLNERREYRAINTTTWHASDALTIKNIISYTQLTGDYVSDIFSSNIKIPTTVFVPIQDPATGALLALQPTPTGALAGTRLQFTDVTANGSNHNTDQSTFTEELQFQGRIGGDKFVWQAGAYYERSAPHGATQNFSTQLVNCTDITKLQCSSPLGQIYRQGYAQYFANLFGVPAQFTDPGFDFPIGGVGKHLTTIGFRNLGIYAQGTYALTSQLKVTGGIRYTSDKVKASDNDINYVFGGPGFGANNPSVSCIQTDALIANNCLITAKTKSSKPTWLIDLDYKPNDDILLYAKYSRGYRQGSVSPSAAGTYRTFKPEKIDAFETGLKADLRGALRGYFNIDAFYNNLYGQQINAAFTAVGGNVPQAQGIVNVKKSRSYGVEAEFSVSPFRGFNLNGSYTYLRTKLVSAPVPVAPPPYTRVDLSADQGGDLAYSPHNRFTVTGSYTLPLDPGIGQIVFATTYSYSSSQFAVSPSSSSLGKIKSFNTLNLNLNWNHVGGSKLDASVFATNVTNENYQTQVAGIFAATGVEFARYGEQRVVGGKLRYNF